MTGWRHANGDMTWINVPSNPPICMDCIAENEHPYDFCTTPTPDPSSPCALPGCGEALGGAIDSTNHPHVTTLCERCGHGVRAAA